MSIDPATGPRRWGRRGPVMSAQLCDVRPRSIRARSAPTTRLVAMICRRRRLLITIPLAAIALAGCGPAGASPSALPGLSVGSLGRARPERRLQHRADGRSGGRPDRHRLGSHLGHRAGRVPALPGRHARRRCDGEPASARFAVEGGDPLAIAAWFQDAPRDGDLQYGGVERSGRGRRLRHRLGRRG